MRIKTGNKICRKLMVIIMVIAISIPLFAMNAYASDGTGEVQKQNTGAASDTGASATETDNETSYSTEDVEKSLKPKESQTNDDVEKSLKSLIKIVSVNPNPLRDDGVTTKTDDDGYVVTVKPLGLGFKVDLQNSDEFWYAMSENILPENDDKQDIFLIIGEHSEDVQSYGAYFQLDDYRNVVINTELINGETKVFSLQDDVKKLKDTDFGCLLFELPDVGDVEGFSFRTEKTEDHENVYEVFLNDNCEVEYSETQVTGVSNDVNNNTIIATENISNVNNIKGSLLLDAEGKLIGLGSEIESESDSAKGYRFVDSTDLENISDTKKSEASEGKKDETDNNSGSPINGSMVDESDSGSYSGMPNIGTSDGAAIESETVINTDDTDSSKLSNNILLIVLIIFVILLAGLCGYLLYVKKVNDKEKKDLHRKIKNYERALKDYAKKNYADSEVGAVSGISVGSITNIGKRNGQQDRCAYWQCPSGAIMAVLADGMGGLQDGDKVSQKIVDVMKADSIQITAGKSQGILYQMASHVNDSVNSMIGPEKYYKCGSTFIAVLADRDKFYWLTIGDSRLYLYRDGVILQINREHVYRSDLLIDAINKDISFQNVLTDPQTDKLTSFIGMGKLRYVDGNFRPIKIIPGDKLILMSDGVFNTLSEMEIEDVLTRYAAPQDAADRLEDMVLNKNKMHQDNFTAVILSFDSNYSENL